MRYRIGEMPGEAGLGGTETVLLLTVLLSLLIGVVLTWLGIRGRQIWLATWSGGLIVASLAYLGWIAFGPR